MEEQLSLQDLAEDDHYDQDVAPQDILTAWGIQGGHLVPATILAAAAEEWLQPELLPRRLPTGWRADGTWMPCRNPYNCSDPNCVFAHPGQEAAVDEGMHMYYSQFDPPAQQGSLSGLLLGMGGRNLGNSGILMML